MTKPFNEEKAKAGAPVQTIAGHKVRILCYDRASTDYPIVGLVTHCDGSEYLCSWTQEGLSSTLHSPDTCDLVMVPVKKEGWINLYTNHPPTTSRAVYSTKEEAILVCVGGAIQVRIAWEE